MGQLEVSVLMGQLEVSDWPYGPSRNRNKNRNRNIYFSKAVTIVTFFSTLISVPMERSPVEGTNLIGLATHTRIF